MVHYGDVASTEIHNIYGLKWAKIVFENWQNEFPEKRLFNLSRSGFTGMQRYSTFPWSGDIQRSFDAEDSPLSIPGEELISGRYILKVNWSWEGLKYEVDQSVFIP